MKGEFSKKVVMICVRTMILTLAWAMAIATAALALDRAYNINDVLLFAGSFFGGELCLLAAKRIFAKERDEDNGSNDMGADCDGGDPAAGGGDFYDLRDSADQEEDYRG